jgi:hypothetical protein
MGSDDDILRWLLAPDDDVLCRRMGSDDDMPRWILAEDDDVLGWLRVVFVLLCFGPVCPFAAVSFPWPRRFLFFLLLYLQKRSC